MAEMRAFVFAITFITLFTGLLIALPIGLQGAGDEPNVPIPLVAGLITDFEDSVYYTGANLSVFETLEYTLGSYNWFYSYSLENIYLSTKVMYFGSIWLGQLASCSFIAPDGTIIPFYGLDFDTITEDAVNGTVRYSVTTYTGDTGGGFVIYWNITAYPDIADAWTADELYFIHGVGVAPTASYDALALLISLLTLQLPDCPKLINLLIVTPIYATVVYLFWYFIKEVIS